VNKINRKLEYALIALKYMQTKTPGELSTAKEISSQFHMPFDATARVMQILAQKGILKSEQGTNGGYQIIKDLNKTSLHELMKMIVGPVNLAKCFQKEKTSQERCEVLEHCSIMSPMHALNKKLVEFYEGIKLGDLLEPKHDKLEVFSIEKNGSAYQQHSHAGE